MGAAAHRAVAHAAATGRRRLGPAGQGAAGLRRDRPCQRQPLRHHHAGDRYGAVQRFRPAPDLDDLHPVEPLPRGARGQGRIPAGDRRSRAHPPDRDRGRRRRRHQQWRGPGAARRGGARDRTAGAAGDRSPGPVPGGDRVVQPRSGRGAGRCRCRHPASARPARHAGVDPDHVPGSGARLPGIAHQHAAADRRRDHHHVHRPRRALRELHPPGDDPVDVAVGRGWSAARAVALGTRTRYRRDHRPDPADRHREEERDHDDRLRPRGRARRGQIAARRDLRGQPAAVPPDHDDDPGGAARSAAADDRRRRRFGDASAAGHCDGRAGCCCRRC